MKRLLFWEIRSVTLSSKGQMTAPKAICHHHGLKPGDRLTITIEDEASFRAVPATRRTITP